MNIEQLQQAGRLLYGDQWQSNLARELNIDSRRIRQWISGKRPISDWVYAEVLELLEKNRNDINNFIELLENTMKYYLIETKYIGPDFVTNPHVIRITTKPACHVESTDIYVERDNLPSIVSKGYPIVINGSLGCSNDFEGYAHGEFDSLAEAEDCANRLFGDMRENDDNKDPDVVKEFYVGKYNRPSDETLGEYCYEMLENTVTVDMSDDDVIKLATELERCANTDGLTGDDYWLNRIKEFKDELNNE